MSELKSILKSLAETMPYKWRVQSFSKYDATAQCVAYIDARQVMERLDDVCEWQDKYYEVCGQLYCSIGIKIDGEWHWRTDCGVESNVEKEKGQASDAFKRAAVKWGVGRFLYSLKIRKVNTNGKKDEKNRFPFVTWANGSKVFNLTEYITKIEEHERANS